MEIEAGRIMIRQMNDYVKKNESFAFETTLSGKGYAKKIREWKDQGYEIIIYFLRLPSAEFAIERVKLRVSKGGHNVSEIDIKRRFERSWATGGHNTNSCSENPNVSPVPSKVRPGKNDVQQTGQADGKKAERR